MSTKPPSDPNATPPNTSPADGGTAVPSSDTADAPGGPMTEKEIRSAGLMIDLPYESGSADPQPLTYADFLPDAEKYQGPQEVTLPAWAREDYEPPDTDQ